MKNEKLLHAIGKIDDNLVSEATPEEKKVKRFSWIKWGAVAACLVLALTVVIPMLTHNPDEVVPGDLAPMVFVKDTLYMQSATQTSFDELDDEFIYLGEIASQVDQSQIPHEEFQANDNIIGSKVYQYGDDIVVLIKDKYWLYEKRVSAQDNSATIEYDGNFYNKADLSAETIKWIVWYNSLSEEDKLAVSAIPSELLRDNEKPEVLDADE